MEHLAALIARGWSVQIMPRAGGGVHVGGMHPRGNLIAYGMAETIADAARHADADARRVEERAWREHLADCAKHGVSKEVA